MNADEQKVSPPAGSSPPKSPPRPGYSRRIDCAPAEPPRPDAAAHEVENGRGTGRLRNPREDH